MKIPEKLNRIILGPFFFRWGPEGLIIGSCQRDVERHLHIVFKTRGVQIHATDETQPSGLRSIASAWLPMNRLERFFNEFRDQTLRMFLQSLDPVEHQFFSERGYRLLSGRRTAPAFVRRHLRLQKRTIRVRAGRDWTFPEVAQLLERASFEFSELDRFRHQPPGSVSAFRLDEDGGFEMVKLFYCPPPGWIDGRPSGWYYQTEDAVDYSKVMGRMILAHAGPDFYMKWDEIRVLSGLGDGILSGDQLRARLIELANGVTPSHDAVP